MPEPDQPTTVGPIMVGRVLRANTAAFVLGCNQLISAQDEFIPEFGAFVKGCDARGDTIYGLIYDVGIEDDAFVRQLVAAGVAEPEIIEDHRRNRQVLVSVSVLVLGYAQRGAAISHRLPPQPPATLREIHRCANAEIVRLTFVHTWLRTVLASVEAPSEQLLGSAIRRAAEARPPDQRDLYRLEAGRELVRLCLPNDLPRAEAILRQVR